MTMLTEINRIKNNINKAYTSCSAKGATLPETQNANNLSATIDSIKKGKYELARYEIVDGVAQTTSKKLTGDEFADIKEIDDSGLFFAFYQCSGLTGSVNFPNLTSVGDSGLSNAFDGCKGLTGSVNFSNLTSVGDSGLSNAFSGCSGLTSVSFPKLTSVGKYGLYGTFPRCSGLTSVSFPKLTSVEGYGLYNAFYNIPNITIHFRKDMESTISSQSGYPKFGASNATVLFDL